MLLHRLAADAILLTHFLFVAFVVVGFLLIVTGIFFHTQWARHFWLRTIHLLAIALVVVETWIGMTCPLTTWESQLRTRAGSTSYPGDFLAYWVSSLLFYDAPQWVFTLIYCTFALAVLLSWLLAPPQWPWPKHVKPHKNGP